MAYATLQQFIDRFGEQMLIELTDRADPPAGAIDETAVTRAQKDADALIDGYLKGRYKLPLTSTPDLLVNLELDIGIYKMHRNVASDKIAADYKAAITTLQQISNGTIRLDVDGIEPAASGATGVQVTDRPRDLTPCNLKDFI